MDDEIIKVLRKSEKNGRGALSINTLAELSEMSEQAVWKRIKSLERWGMVEKKTERKTSFWGIRE